MKKDLPAFGMPVEVKAPPSKAQKETREERLIRLRYEMLVKQDQQEKRKKERQKHQQKIDEAMQKEPQLYQVGSAIQQAQAVSELIGGYEGS